MWATLILTLRHQKYFQPFMSPQKVNVHFFFIWKRTARISPHVFWEIIDYQRHIEELKNSSDFLENVASAARDENNINDSCAVQLLSRIVQSFTSWPHTRAILYASKLFVKRVVANLLSKVLLVPSKKHTFTTHKGGNLLSISSEYKHTEAEKTTIIFIPLDRADLDLSTTLHPCWELTASPNINDTVHDYDAQVCQQRSLMPDLARQMKANDSTGSCLAWPANMIIL